MAACLLETSEHPHEPVWFDHTPRLPVRSVTVVTGTLLAPRWVRSPHADLPRRNPDCLCGELVGPDGSLRRFSSAVRRTRRVLGQDALGRTLAELCVAPARHRHPLVAELRRLPGMLGGAMRSHRGSCISGNGSTLVRGRRRPHDAGVTSDHADRTVVQHADAGAGRGDALRGAGALPAAAQHMAAAAALYGRGPDGLHHASDHSFDHLYPRNP